jgi:exodeoxyribonuclease V alpha subunit
VEFKGYVKSIIKYNKEQIHYLVGLDYQEEVSVEYAGRRLYLNKYYTFSGKYLNPRLFDCHKITTNKLSDLEVWLVISYNLAPFLSINKAEALFQQYNNKIYSVLSSEISILENNNDLLDNSDILLFKKFKNIFNIEYLDTLTFLIKENFTFEYSTYLFEKVGSSLISILLERPFDLVYQYGFEYEQTIQLANSVSSYNHSDFQILEAFCYNIIIQLLKTLMYCSFRQIINHIEKKGQTLKYSLDCEINEENVRLSIDHLVEKNIIVQVKQSYTLPEINNTEISLSEYIIQRLNNRENSLKSKGFEDRVVSVIEHSNTSFSTQQLQAMKLSLTSNISIITGSPGTGKSQVILGIVDLLRNVDESLTVDLCTPTGKASQRLHVNGSNVEAKTIHRLLGITKNNYDDDELNYIDSDVLIIDEMSMVSNKLFLNLLKHTDLNTSIILVGDVHQLQAIESGNVLETLVNFEGIPKTDLTYIFRQNKDSHIINFCLDILYYNILDRVNLVSYDTKYDDLEFIELKEKDTINYIKDYFEISINSDLTNCVLLPQYKGELGIDEINYQVQDHLLQFKENRSSCTLHDQHSFSIKTFYLGDRVIQLENDYNSGVMNGTIGIVSSFKDGKMSVNYEYCSADYNIYDYNKLSLAYAISIHKAQGAEFDNVILIVDDILFPYYNRKMLYTAVSRAKQHLTVLGKVSRINEIIKKHEYSKKTYLLDYLRGTI